MTNQPKWVCVANLGDNDPINHGGAFVYVDTTGVYAPEMELLEPPCDDDINGRYMAYRVCLEPHTYRRHPIGGGKPILSDNSFHPESRVWYAHGAADKWHRAGLLDVCESSGIEQEDLIGLLCNTDAIKRATGYQYLIGHYGPNEFDQYPLTLTRGEVSRRYRSEVKRVAGGKSYRVAYLKKDRKEKVIIGHRRTMWKSGLRSRTSFINAWRIADFRGRDLVQPWFDTKTEARGYAKSAGIVLIEKVGDCEHGVPRVNLDCESIETLRGLLPTLRGRLRRYAENKISAIECRSSGRIHEALLLEDRCNRLYRLLPENEKW